MNENYTLTSDSRDKAYCGLRNELRKKITKEWYCENSGKVDIELKFELTKDGNFYHLNLSRGFEDPYAIRAAVHAVLFAMPATYSTKQLKKILVTCNISGDQLNPKIQISLSEGKHSLLGERLKNVPGVDKLKRTTFIQPKMVPRLNALSECLFDFPDSVETRAEIQKVCTYIGLDTIEPDAWIAIGRAENRTVLIDQTSPKDKLAVQRTLAATLEAWRIEHNKSTLCELENAWLRNMALDIIAVSKGDPLLLGNAAFLTNQIGVAKDQYKLAAKGGGVRAISILQQMRGETIDKHLTELKLRDEFIPDRTSASWTQLINWLPTDTEVVLYETKSLKPRANPFSFFGDLILPDSPQKLKAIHLLDTEVVQNNTLFKDVTVAYCLHAARTFKIPIHESYIKSGTSDGVDIIVFSEQQKQVAKKAISALRKKCINREELEGIEVLGFDKSPWSFGLSIGERCFICAPYDGVLVASSNRGYLREILMRLRMQPKERALPSHNPEWKFVDTSSRIWAVRHYDRNYIPFDMCGMYDIASFIFDDDLDESSTQNANSQAEINNTNREIGFSFHTTGSSLTLHHLSTNPKTLACLAKSYKYDGSCVGMSLPYKTSSSTNTPNISVNKDVLTAKGNFPHNSFIKLRLCQALGYYVSI